VAWKKNIQRLDEKLKTNQGNQALSNQPEMLAEAWKFATDHPTLDQEVLAIL